MLIKFQEPLPQSCMVHEADPLVPEKGQVSLKILGGIEYAAQQPLPTPISDRLLLINRVPLFSPLLPTKLVALLLRRSDDTNIESLLLR